MKIGRKLHGAPTSHVKPAPSAEDSDLLASSPEAIEDGQLLATKPPPARRLRNKINDDMLFPYHARLDYNQKMHGESDFILYYQANEQVARVLAKTLAKTGPFRDRDTDTYFLGKPSAVAARQEK